MSDGVKQDEIDVPEAVKLAEADLEHALEALREGPRKRCRPDTAFRRTRRAQGYVEDAVTRLEPIRYRNL